ncbi:MAG: TlpA family protein disulfide reductase [Betaproteobacteria bacterium]|nr:TlpA family protein disulfide reductase [Betaproteobacteria bacterium]NDE53788.1 TlpA family protein disulfide reductase [Actinomycetota bacterium]
MSAPWGLSGEVLQSPYEPLSCRRRWIVRLIAAAQASGLAAVAASWPNVRAVTSQQGTSAQQDRQEGTDAKRFPGVDLLDASGQTYQLGDSASMPSGMTLMYIDFWASWCGPCRQSFPWMQQMHLRYKARGLGVVAINLDRNREQADRFLAQFPAEFTILFDQAAESAKRMSVRAMPSSFLVDRRWTILHRHEGFRARETELLEAQIRQALQRGA